MIARRAFPLVVEGIGCAVIKGILTENNHAFDVCYYPILDSTRGRPYGLYLHGNEGTEGAERAVQSITTGLGWVKAADYVAISGKPGKPDLEACWELGATVAAQLMG
jgi:hypothetical protein